MRERTRSGIETVSRSRKNNESQSYFELFLQLVIFPQIIEEHPDGDAGDDAVADDAEQIWDLAEKQEAKACGEDDLGVVEDRNFPGGSTGVGCRDGELTAGGRKPR